MPPAFADDEVGVGVMRAMGRALEDGRLGVNMLRTGGMHKGAAQVVADALGLLTPVEAASLAERGQRFAATGPDPTGREDFTGIVRILHDQDSFRSAVDAMHAPPVGHNVNYVGNARSWDDDVWTPDSVMLAQENLRAIIHDPKSSAEDKAYAYTGIGALAKAHGFLSPELKVRFYEAIGDEEKMRSYGEMIKRTSREVGFDYDDWQPPSWIEGYDAEGEQKQWREEMKKRGRR
jgi:hypothetical protein